MRRITYFVLGFTLVLSGCTNYIYEGRLTATDAYGNERHFILYWPKTDPLIGAAKAGPAVLLTECSTTRIDFDDRPAGIIFRGEQGRDRLPEKGATTAVDQTCGKILGYAKLVNVPAGDLKVEIDCEPVSDEFAAQPRDYLKARSEPYVFPVVEKTKRWSLFGETLPAPVLACPKTTAR